MAYQIIECSPQARAKIKQQDEGVEAAPTTINIHPASKYPIDELRIGQAFAVPFAEANETSLRITASNRGKKNGKKFSVIKHPDFNCIEVARIA